MHANNYIYARRIYDDEVRQKVYPPYGNTNCRAYMHSLHLKSRWANNHGVLHDGDGQMMLYNNLWCYEGMRCFGIKQNCCRVWVYEEHTQYHILGLLGFLSSHMVGPTIGDDLLPLGALLLISSLGRPPVGAILGHVAWQSTLETGTKSLTSLRGGVLLVLCCRPGNLRLSPSQGEKVLGGQSDQR
jgi:hypothetical protein